MERVDVTSVSNFSTDANLSLFLAFRNGRAAVLVATDVAARGLGMLLSRNL